MSRDKYKVTDEMIAEMQKLYKRRIPVRQIADYYDISVSTVHYYTGHGAIPKLPISEILEAMAA